MGPSPERAAMFEILEDTSGDVVAVRVGGPGSRQGYESLYDRLVRVTEEYGSVRVYEEATGWTASTFLSHGIHGILPDLRYGLKVTLRRYAAVGDSGGRSSCTTSGGSSDPPGRWLLRPCATSPGPNASKQ